MSTKLITKSIYFIVFIVSLLCFSAITLSLPPKSHAACWCENGWDDGCQCNVRGTGPFSTNYYGITVYCNTQLEANTLFSIKEPICGSSVETLPYCAPMNEEPWQYTCWGTEFVDPNSSNIPLDRDNEIFDWSGPFIFNSTLFGDSGTTQIFTCRAGNTCCSRHDLSCNLSDQPDTPSSCITSPELDGDFPLLDICTTTTFPPSGPTVDCSKTVYPEFHTYRPYPAKPCNPFKQDLATMCGNTLTFWDDLSMSFNASAIGTVCTLPDQTDCCDPGEPDDGTTTCRRTQDMQKNITVELEDAEFPIMGNTENVANNDQAEDEDEFTDAAKVNEYVSWYLNGVNNNPTEYSRLFAPNDPNDFSYSDDLHRIIDFSGPLKKLTPHRKYRDYVAGSGFNDEDENGQIQEAGITRHNQVVGCRTAEGEVRDCFEFLEFDPLRLTDWEDLLPPREENYEGLQDWYLSYREWKGDLCISFFEIFGLDLSICLDNPFNPNWVGNLFYHIPFSSTEDRLGEVAVIGSNIQPAQANVEISNVQITTDPADLYFPHMEEDVKLARDLQKTFVPKENIDLGGEVNVAPAETSEYCDLVRVRSNPGDDLYPGELSANVTYDAEIECEFNDLDGLDGSFCSSIGGSCGDGPDNYTHCGTNWGQTDCPSGQICCRDRHSSSDPDPTNLCRTSGGVCLPGNWNCSDEIGDLCEAYFDCFIFPGCTAPPPEPIPNQSCTRQVQMQLNLETRTPLANEAWSRTVAGPSSIFQKIFPEISRSGPLETIYDIPGVTDVTYNPHGDSVTVGNPSNLRTGTELYFPHIGSIHEYFLQCTQTALRPQGFGESCEEGTLTPNPPTGDPACDPPDSYCLCMEQHPDVNAPEVRGYIETDGVHYAPINFHTDENLLDYAAPQLNTLVAGRGNLAVNSLYIIYRWDWENSIPLNPIGRPVDLPASLDWANLVGFTTYSSDVILVPDSDYDIGGGHDVMVLYASPSSITLKYTREDDVVYGYTIHLENFNVDPDILNLYNQLDAEGRQELPALCGGQRIGTGRSGEIRVSIRDTGAFLDPRWRDWWLDPSKPSASETACDLSSIPPIGGVNCPTDVQPTGNPVPVPVPSSDCYPGPEPYSAELDAIINTAIARGQAAAVVPREMLEAIYYIESHGQWNNPNYTCTTNQAGALGLMQITQFPYNLTVPYNQRVNDVGQCDSVPEKLSRCNVVDAIEIAARTLLVKVGMWDYNSFEPLGSITSMRQVYCSSSGYYGSSEPTGTTDDRANELGVPDNSHDGRTSYPEIVCHQSDFCPSADNYPWYTPENRRPDAEHCLAELP